jgi:hypothetical protein
VVFWLLELQKLRLCWRSDDKISFKNTSRHFKQLYHIPEQVTDAGAAGERSEPLIAPAPRRGRKRQADGAEAELVVEDVIEEVCLSVLLKMPACLDLATMRFAAAILVTLPAARKADSGQHWLRPRHYQTVTVKKRGGRRREPDPLPCVDPTREHLVTLLSQKYTPPPRPIPNLGYACLNMVGCRLLQVHGLRMLFAPL